MVALLVTLRERHEENVAGAGVERHEVGALAGDVGAGCAGGAAAAFALGGAVEVEGGAGVEVAAVGGGAVAGQRGERGPDGFAGLGGVLQALSVGAGSFYCSSFWLPLICRNNAGRRFLIILNHIGPFVMYVLQMVDEGPEKSKTSLI